MTRARTRGRITLVAPAGFVDDGVDDNTPRVPATFDTVWFLHPSLLSRFLPRPLGLQPQSHTGN